MYQPLNPRETRANERPAGRRRGFALLGLSLLLGGTVAVVGQDVTQPGPPPLPVPDVQQPGEMPADPVENANEEVLTRGPLHEAFAQPVNVGREAAPLVEKQPPATIEELPPDERPEGENVMWIPGYWAWDDDRSDFLWVSGVYRDVPPNQTWVAGYWSQVAGGYQWVPGFWAAQKSEEIVFYPEPPASLDEGPTTAQPSENHFWVVGNWRYTNNRYAWSAGYWAASQPGWIWSPAYYSWTPQGYCYTGGFWDYTLAQRGACFAPIYFRPTYFANPYAYTPGIILRTNFLTVHLWSRPRYNHYYFGDYYGGGFVNAGYRPWFSPIIANRPCYDPLFTYYSWQGRRGNPNWNNVIHQRHDYLVANAGYRPPHTYAAMRELSRNPQIRQNITNINVINSRNTDIDIVNVDNRGRGPGRGDREFGKFDGDLTSLQVQNAAFADRIDRVAKQQRDVPNAPVKFEKIDAQARERFVRQGEDFRELAKQRRTFDSTAATRPGDLNGAAKGDVRPLPGKAGPDLAAGGSGKMKFQPVRPNRDGKNPVVVTKPETDDVRPGRDLPNRDLPGRDLPGRDNPGRTANPGTIGKNVDDAGPLNPDRNPLNGKNPLDGKNGLDGKNPTDSRVGRDRPEPLDIPAKGNSPGKNGPRSDDVFGPGRDVPDATLPKTGESPFGGDSGKTRPGRDVPKLDRPDPTFPGNNPATNNPVTPNPNGTGPALPNNDNPFPGTRKIGDLPSGGNTPNGLDNTPGKRPNVPNNDNPFPGTRKIGDLPTGGNTPNGVDNTPGKRPNVPNNDNPFPGTRKIGDLPTGGTTPNGLGNTPGNRPNVPNNDNPFPGTRKIGDLPPRDVPNPFPGKKPSPTDSSNPFPGTRKIGDLPPRGGFNPNPGNNVPGGNLPKQDAPRPQRIDVPKNIPNIPPRVDSPRSNPNPTPNQPQFRNNPAPRGNFNPGAGPRNDPGKGKSAVDFRASPTIERARFQPKIERSEPRPIAAAKIDRPQPQINRPAPRPEQRATVTPRIERSAQQARPSPRMENRPAPAPRNNGEDRKKK